MVKNHRGLCLIFFLAGYGIFNSSLAAEPIFMQEFTDSYTLKPVFNKTKIVSDWRIEDQNFLALSGKVFINQIIPRLGGQAPTRSYLRYEFASPRDNETAVQMVKDFSLLNELNTLTATGLDDCLKTVARMKAPQVKTLFWQQKRGRIAKVYCGRNATTEFIVFDDRDLNSSYWQLGK